MYDNYICNTRYDMMTNYSNDSDDQELSDQDQTAQKAGHVNRASQHAPKGGLIQFRVEDQLMARLKAMAQLSGSSPGMLCRQWALEKIHDSETQHLKRASEWHKERVKALQEEGHTKPYYAERPYFILHAVALNDNRIIPPDVAESIAKGLRPIRAGRSWVGRFNHLGYQSYASDDSPAKAHLQVFRSGEMEALRPIWQSQINGVIDGPSTDAEIVDAASTLCATLAGLQIPLPYALFITVCNVKGLTMAHGYSPIQVDSFSLGDVEIKSWDQIAKQGSIEPMAQSLHAALDVLWNAGGVKTSPTFKGDRWIFANQSRV
jgi:hypothetical protein